MRIYGNSSIVLKGKLIQSNNTGILIKFKRNMKYDTKNNNKKAPLFNISD